MKEFIESIIEIILEDVSCDHQIEEEYSGGPAFDDVAYSLNDEKAVIRKCVEAIPARLIERPEITEGFIDKKATELHDKLWPGEKCGGQCNRQREIKDFLSSLLNELAAKINLIER
ncbi:MAG: hypothetical protein KAU46_13400 [Candidatus Aminicenantes bacterium]|nr:hypothetical protein [Candidatus Aminicenantes bacterium]